MGKKRRENEVLLDRTAEPARNFAIAERQNITSLQGGFMIQGLRSSRNDRPKASQFSLVTPRICSPR